MKKIVALLLAAMMMVAVFASCGGDNGGSSSSKGSGSGSDTQKYENAGKGFDANVADADFGDEKDATLKVWGPDEYTTLLTEQCEAFKKKFPGKVKKIEVVVQSESDSATMMQNDPKAGADVFGFASDQFTNLTNAKILAPVNAKYAADVEATNNKAAVDISKAKNSATGQDALYAFPETGNGYFLVYDKRVIKDEDAKTFEGLLAACKKAGKKFIMDVGNGYYACMFAFTGGLSLEGLDKDGNQLFNDYNKDDVVASLKAFSKLMHDYKGTFMTDATAAIPSGFTSTATRPTKVGAGIDGNWDTSGIKKALGEENFGAAKIPTINIDGKDMVLLMTLVDSSRLARFFGGEGTYKIDRELGTWASIPLDWKNRAKAYEGLDSVAAHMRMVQMYGLGPDCDYNIMVLFYADPAGIFRPAHDPDITTTSVGLEFPAYANEKYTVGETNFREWYRYSIASAYEDDSPLPWTQMGYTYDWHSGADSHVGVSEYIGTHHTLIKVKEHLSEWQFIQNLSK